MKTLVKLAEDQYAEYDEELERLVTVPMTREEAYIHRLKGQADELASYAIQKADLTFKGRELENGIHSKL